MPRNMRNRRNVSRVGCVASGTRHLRNSWNDPERVAHQGRDGDDLIPPGQLRVLQQVDHLDHVPAGQVFLADPSEVGEGGDGLCRRPGHVQPELPGRFVRRGGRVEEGPGALWLEDLALSPDGRRVLAGSESGRLYEWELHTAKRLHRLEPKGGFEPPSELYEGSVFPTKLLRQYPWSE